MTLLQTNAAINEGNSGGPLLNMYGQVVGITNMKMMGTSAYSAIEGIGFAIPTSTIQEVVNQLLRNGRVTGRAAIGVTIGPIPEDAAAAYSLPDGLYVVSVAEGSDAAAKGLAEGDVITAIDGQGVATTAQVGEIIAGLEVGDTITMTVYRNGETFDVEVALVEDQRHLLILLTPFPYIFPSLKQTTGPKRPVVCFLFAVSLIRAAPSRSRLLISEESTIGVPTWP